MNSRQLHFPHREMESIPELLLLTIPSRIYLNASRVRLWKVQFQLLFFLGIQNKPVRNLRFLSIFPQELLLMLRLEQMVSHLIVRKQLEINRIPRSHKAMRSTQRSIQPIPVIVRSLLHIVQHSIGLQLLEVIEDDGKNVENSELLWLESF